MALTNYNPATDEQSLVRCVQRLKEIAEELGKIGQFLEETPRLNVGPDFEVRLAKLVERNRIPGFCGHRLVLEAKSLVELFAWQFFATGIRNSETNRS